MITLKQPVDFPMNRTWKDCPKEQLMFFDIETTGFSREHSMVYLIGCIFYRENSWQLIQWFADSPQAEPELLTAFFRFLKGCHTLVHFNRDSFDIPFLLKRCQIHGLSWNFSSIQSFDIYKQIRPYRNLLGLSSLKQKSIEQFLGIFREDRYNGGQLIEIYQDYLVSREDWLFNLLILHNQEDLTGMSKILPILNYPDFFTKKFHLKEETSLSRTDVFGNAYPCLKLVCQNDIALPSGFSLSCSLAAAEAAKDCLTLWIDLYQGEIKYFYPDYKNYYYLIYEDQAVHKSIGEYVDKSARKKATAKTCYCRRNGCWLPQFTSRWKPVLKKDYSDKITYIPFEEDFFQKEDNLNLYIQDFFQYLNRLP